MKRGLGFALAAALGIAACIGVAPASAQQFPTKPIRLIVPFAAGGAADLSARVLATGMTDKLGQPVVVENRPGASGATGSIAVARSAPDGYTILMTVVSSHVVTPAIKKDPPFDPLKEFTPIVKLVDGVHTLVVRNSLPVSNLRELIAYAKESPGKLNFGSAGLGSLQFVAGKLFERAAGIELTHIPFNGDGPAMASVVSGNVDLIFTPSARSYVESNSVKLIGLCSLERAASTPNWPTLHESGLPGFTLVSWLGIMAPAGTPDAIVQRLNKAANEVLSDPAVRSRLEQIGYTTAGGTPEQFADAIRRDIDRLAALNLKID
jgi:tripartite-type tricarboxylate transporter receptor subunit TctC